MALHANIEWDIRPANGSDNNGGGFKAGATGVDRSQQNGAFASLTTLSLVHTTTTQINVSLTDYTVSADDVGNVLQITGGSATAGFYEITAVDVGNNRWTLDRSAGTAAQTVVGAMGGALATVNKANGALVAGQKIHVKAEAWNEAVSITVAGTSAAPIVIEGYTSTHGDGGSATNNRASAAGDAITCSVTGLVFKNLIATAAGGDGFDVSTASSIKYINCRATANGGAGFNASQNGGIRTYINCQSDGNTGGGFVAGGGNASTMLAIGCESRGNGGNGYQATSSGEIRIVHCLCYGNSATGITPNQGTTAIINTTVHSNTGASSDGYSFGAAGFNITIWNCIFSSNGRYGINFGSSTGHSPNINYNNFHSNGTAARNNIAAGANDLALDPQYTDASNGNFTIGTNLKAAGFPGLFPRGVTTGYLDMGAVQRQEPAGGGDPFPSRGLHHIEQGVCV